MARDLIAEAQEAHNRAMRTDPTYRQEYAMDIFREEMSGYLPYTRREEEKEPPIPTEVWLDDRQEQKVNYLIKEIQRLKSEARHLENRLNKHIDEEVSR